MSDEESFGSPRRSWKDGWTWKRGLLVGSIALNLFFVGLIGAWQGRALFGPPPPGPSIPRMFEGTLRELPAEDRHLLERTFEQRRMEIAKLAEGLRRTRSAMSRSLRAGDFDAADFDAKANDARQARARLDAALHRVYRDAASGMTPEGRAKLGNSRRPG